MSFKAFIWQPWPEKTKKRGKNTNEEKLKLLRRNMPGIEQDVLGWDLGRDPTNCSCLLIFPFNADDAEETFLCPEPTPDRAALISTK
jgi:hypothetical protein